METRKAKISSCKAGGTAAKGSRTFKLSIPSSWVKETGTDVFLSFDGGKITISPRKTAREFAEGRAEIGHDVAVIKYYDRKKLCTTIYADKTSGELRIENHTDDFISTAFGKNELPDWNDLESFLEDRCIPQKRAGLDHYLESIGLLEYDPWQIVAKTQGRMAEDEQWLEVTRFI